MSEMRLVGIDGRCLGRSGGAGIETAVRGLVAGLAGLDGPERYLLLVDPIASADVSELASANVDVISDHSTSAIRLEDSFRRRTERSPRLRSWLARAAVLKEESLGRVPVSSGVLEALGCNVIHFPTPAAFVTNLPSLYQPHDLQHRHLPEFFPAGVRTLRDVRYERWCKSADIIVVGSQWIARDLREQFPSLRTPVHVIPLAPEEGRVGRPGRGARRRDQLPFVLYPAQTWPHKNHIVLLEALAILRQDRSIEVRAICPGTKTEWFSAIKERCQALGVDDLVSFPGFVSDEELGRLYADCEFVVVPSLFEAGSFPMWEAFRSGKTAAVSGVTSLPAMSQGAAEIFDPRSSAECAQAIELLWTDRARREALEARAVEVISRYSWFETSRRMRTRYRMLAGWELDEWDRSTLAFDPLAF